MSFLDDIFQFLTGLSGIFDRIVTLVTDIEELVVNIRREVRQIKQFKYDPKWKNRVINVPAAISHTQDLATSLVDEVTNALHSLVSNLKAVVQEHRLPGEGGGGVGTVLNYITKLNNFVNEVDQAVKALDSFVDAIRSVREELETLDSIFLGQGNSRRWEHLEDGTPIRLRIGNLHS